MKAAVLAAALLVCGSAGAAPTQISLHVWVVRLDGTGRADLTAAEELATSPSVAPDGTISYVNGDGHVWLMNADGTDKRPLGSVPGPGELELASAPTWSPGGGDVAYTLVRLVPGAECASWSIVVRDAGTGDIVSTLADALGPSWAPTAPRIALESNTAHCKQLLSRWRRWTGHGTGWQSGSMRPGLRGRPAGGVSPSTAGRLTPACAS